jgi:hypothetical protein
LVVVDILMELMVVEKSDGVANLGVGQLSWTLQQERNSLNCAAYTKEL